MSRTVYSWDPCEDNLVAELDESGFPVRNFITDPELHGRLFSSIDSTGPRFLHFDGIGSTLAETDRNGTVVSRFEYTAFGSDVSQPSNLAYRFVGERGYRDDFTGRLSVRRRLLACMQGRWMSPDPRPFSLAENLFKYAYNRPVTVIDPSGEIAVIPIEDRWLEGAKCGEYVQIKWNFVLDRPAPRDGYIVQMVKFSCHVEPCIECNSLSPETHDTYTYWEAWFVEKGKRQPKALLDKRTDYTDESLSEGGPVGTCGARIYFGAIRFYTIDITNDLGSEDVDPADLKSTWRPNRIYGDPPCRTGTGWLPSTRNKPEWWDTRVPIEGSAYRVMGVKWCCCNDPCACTNGVKAHAIPRLSPNGGE